MSEHVADKCERPHCPCGCGEHCHRMLCALTEKSPRFWLSMSACGLYFQKKENGKPKKLMPRNIRRLDKLLRISTEMAFSVAYWAGTIVQTSRDFDERRARIAIPPITPEAAAAMAKEVTSLFKSLLSPVSAIEPKTDTDDKPKGGN